MIGKHPFLGSLFTSDLMLRYLRRVDGLTTGKPRWGILTNGSRWLLYYQGTQSASEQFFEFDLASILDAADDADGQLALEVSDRRHWLKVFVLVFRREDCTPSEGRI